MGMATAWTRFFAAAPTPGCDHEVPNRTVAINPFPSPGEVPLELPTLPDAAAIRIVDLDGDGCGDLIAAGSQGVSVHWCGDPQEALTTIGPPHATALAALQADADTGIELAVAAEGGVWIVDVGRGEDPRALVVPVDPAVAMLAERLEAADANGDGLADLWVGGGGRIERLAAVSSLQAERP